MAEGFHLGGALGTQPPSVHTGLRARLCAWQRWALTFLRLPVPFPAHTLLLHCELLAGGVGWEALAPGSDQSPWRGVALGESGGPPGLRAVPSTPSSLEVDQAPGAVWPCHLAVWPRSESEGLSLDAPTVQECSARRLRRGRARVPGGFLTLGSVFCSLTPWHVQSEAPLPVWHLQLALGGAGPGVCLPP